jgi:hypothetical protein
LQAQFLPVNDATSVNFSEAQNQNPYWPKSKSLLASLLAYAKLLDRENNNPTKLVDFLV